MNGVGVGGAAVRKGHAVSVKSPAGAAADTAQAAAAAAAAAAATTAPFEDVGLRYAGRAIPAYFVNESHPQATGNLSHSLLLAGLDWDSSHAGQGVASSGDGAVLGWELKGGRHVPNPERPKCWTAPFVWCGPALGVTRTRLKGQPDTGTGRGIGTGAGLGTGHEAAAGVMSSVGSKRGGMHRISSRTDAAAGDAQDVTIRAARGVAGGVAGGAAAILPGGGEEEEGEAAQGRWYPLWNLHVHSKFTGQFVSQPCEC